jgi:hypothetical protein
MKASVQGIMAGASILTRFRSTRVKRSCRFLSGTTSIGVGVSEDKRYSQGGVRKSPDPAHPVIRSKNNRA